MKRQLNILTLSTIALVGTLTGFAASAFAQDNAPPPAPVAPEVRRTGRTSGDIANGGLGVGGTLFVSGLAGPEVVYDFGAWHLDGMVAFDSRPFGVNNDRTTTVQFGIGGWYHLHMGESSDFSVGGAFGLANVSPPQGDGNTAFEFEPGLQIRAFITPNVAVHGGVALVFAFGDRNTGPLSKQIALDSNNITGAFGFTYYFR